MLMLIASNSRMCLWPQVSVEYVCPEIFRSFSLIKPLQVLLEGKVEGSVVSDT